MRELRGRRALVTGATGGIGAAIVEALEAEGAEVAASDLQSPRFAADLSRPGERDRLVAEVERELGPLDILVNNAGITIPAGFEKLTSEQRDQMIAVNLGAPMALTAQALPGMLARGSGHVVSIASLAGKVPTPFESTYSATKWGVVGWSKALRSEYSGRGVGFSVVCPGFVTGVGMAADAIEARGIKLPASLGTVTAEQVGAGVVKAIRRDKRELLVCARRIRMVLALQAVAPGLAARITKATGGEAFRQVAEKTNRL